MKAVTVVKEFLSSALSGLRALFGMLTLLFAVASLSAGAFAEAPPAKKKAPIFDENRTHKVSVFSFMQSLSGRGASYPVLVTLNVKGPKALTEFCDNQPRVNEAVLGVLSRDRAATDRNAALRSIKAPLRKAVNGVLPGKPVRKVSTRTGRSPAEFGPDLVKTKKACKAIRG